MEESAAGIAIINYALAAIMIGVCGAWIFLIKSMTDSFRLTPYLDEFGAYDPNTDQDQAKGGIRSPKGDTPPKVSVILPARNEEGFIEECLESLVRQDYPNYEIIAIDDSSEDGTGGIIARYAKDHPGRIVHVSARPKPEGWMGKNWACMEGYKSATGSLLMFTDADTQHAGNVISLSVKHMQALGLDALSGIPKMLALDFWTRITLPVISTFLHTRFSALNVNNPSKKTGYFFGSFFILGRETYEQVGMHEGVRQEIIEDGALGRKVKESGYSMRMVRAEHLIKAVWARDRGTLWNALKRLMIPLYLQDGRTAAGIFVAVAFLTFAPFGIFTAALISSSLFAAGSTYVLGATAALASVLIYAGTAIETRMGLGLGLGYALFAPLGGAVVVGGFLSGLIRAKSAHAITWRGRRYSPQDHDTAQKSIDI